MTMWRTPPRVGNPSMLVIVNQAVPDTGVTMKVRKQSTNSTPAEPICSEETILSGGRNFIVLTIGPPKNDSMTLGTWTSGIASAGISELYFRFPAAFLRLGGAELTLLPSYRCAVSLAPASAT